MHLLLFVLFTAAFATAVATWKFFGLGGIKRRYMVGVYLLKVLCGVLLAGVYTWYYSDRHSGDAYRFFDDAAILYQSLHESGPATYLKLVTGIGIQSDPEALEYYLRATHMERPHYTGFANDNATIVRANALVMLFSMGHYHVHTAVWCFMSMAGLTALLRLLLMFFPRKRAAMFFSVMLLPTTLFWGSGVLKEGLLIAGLGFFLLAFFRYIYGEEKRSDWLLMAAALFLLLVTKGYVLFCLIPALVGLLLSKATGGRHFWVWFSIPHALVVVLLFVGPHLGDGFKIWELMALRQDAFYNVAQSSGSGSVIALPPIESAADALRNVPHALTVTYLRPWPWEWTSLMYVPAALENLLLMLCLAVMLWNFRRPYGLALPVIAFGLSFAVLLGALTGQVVPVLGAVVRYKLPGLIFLFVTVFACTDHVLFQRRFPWVRRMLRKL
jgi:hypothetical protein